MGKIDGSNSEVQASKVVLYGDGEVSVSVGSWRSRCTKIGVTPSAWVAITAVVAIVAFVIVQPQWCPGVQRCELAHEKVPVTYAAYICCALSSVLIHEFVCLCLTYKNTKHAIRLIPDIKEALMPSAFLVVTFAVLLLENLAFLIGDNAWHAHAMRSRDERLDGLPVYTAIYLEWSMNVPILMTLAGRYALSRPLAEVARPLVVTNVYIVFAWAAYFTSDSTLRGLLVAVSFAMYFWASYDMVNWVRRYSKEDPDANTWGKPFLTIALILVFGIYGAVYLGRLSGVISYKSERFSYMFLDASMKLVASMSFSGIRSSDYHKLILNMLVNTNTVFQRDLQGQDEPMLPF